MTARVSAVSVHILEQQSIDNRILDVLEGQGAQMLDDLDKDLPDVGSARFLLAIKPGRINFDWAAHERRLSRVGDSFDACGIYRILNEAWQDSWRPYELRNEVT